MSGDIMVTVDEDVQVMVSNDWFNGCSSNQDRTVRQLQPPGWFVVDV